MGSDKKKKKKDKVKYVDDGRTIADMSGLYGGHRVNSNGAKGTLKDQARTYFEAVKMMFVPMLVTIGIISLAFLIVYLMLI